MGEKHATRGKPTFLWPWPTSVCSMAKNSIGVTSIYAYQADFQITVSICLDALALMYASEIDACIGAHPVTLLQIIHGSYEHGAVDDLAP